MTRQQTINSTASRSPRPLRAKAGQPTTPGTDRAKRDCRDAFSGKRQTSRAVLVHLWRSEMAKIRAWQHLNHITGQKKAAHGGSGPHEARRPQRCGSRAAAAKQRAEQQARAPPANRRSSRCPCRCTGGGRKRGRMMNTTNYSRTPPPSHQRREAAPAPVSSSANWVSRPAPRRHVIDPLATGASADHFPTCLWECLSRQAPSP